MKSYWIWNYGDYEIYHSNLVNSRRQEYGVDYPVFWKYSDVDRNVKLHSELEAPHDGYVKLFLNGKGYILIDGERFGTEKSIPVTKGKHKLDICVLNLSGLPAAFIESNILATDGTWYTFNEKHERVHVGYEKQYNSVLKNPQDFIFEYEKKSPLREEKTDNGVLYDFGKELFGEVLISGVKPEEKIHVSYGESREEALDTDHSILFEDIVGHESYSLRQRAFRYIFITGTQKASVSVNFEYVPLEYRGKFKCDDEAVNKIWEICAYTLHLNMREVLTEAIKRDRWLWCGDAYQAFKFNKYLFFDKEIVRRSLIALRGKEPFSEHINTIADYSFYWIIGLYEYYVTYGDIDFIGYIYSKAVSLMEFCAKRVNDDGFITAIDDDWIFIDWSDIDKNGAVCAEQMLYIAANRAMEKLSEALCKSGAEYRSTANKLTKNVNKYYWNDEKGAFIDCYESGKNNVTRHANIFAILYGIATDEQKKKIVKNVLQNDAITKITTPYFEGFELDVMGQIGCCEYIENMLNTYWKGMLDLGATTVWEEYNPKMTGAQHYEMYGSKYGKSLCHAWGASPIYLLGKYYLGVTETSVGYESFEVKPQLGGFKFIEGTVPINEGEVRVRLSENELRVTATKSGGVLFWNNKRYNLKENEETVILGRKAYMSRMPKE